jgi:hypothetical protein
MSPWVRRLLAALILLTSAVTTAACGGAFKKYEYEEELFLAIDGSVTVNVNASMAALVVLRGADVDPGRLARPDRDRVRALFAAPGVRVKTPTFSRRDGRRFVHISVDVPDVHQLKQLAPFAWSSYRLEQKGDVIVFRQVVAGSSRKAVAGVTWTGQELVAFRLHVPSKVLFENASTNVQRGNIVAWEQTLTDRLAGTPIDMQVEMSAESILYATLLLFGCTVAAAAVTFAVVVWWVARRGRAARAAESSS